MRLITLIILHCSAVRPGQTSSAAQIDTWHRQRGWKLGIGYTFALIALLTGIAFGVLNMFVPEGLAIVLSNVSTVVSNILQIVAAYYMMTTSLKLLAENNEKAAVQLGGKLWIVYILSSLLLIICSVLSTISSMPQTVLAYACGVFGVFRSLALVIFLAKACKRV